MDEFNFLLIISLFKVYDVIGTSEQVGTVCTLEQGGCFNEPNHVSMWNENNNKILSLINEAEKNYEPCPYENASCFLHILERDLKPFSGGISKEQFISARKLFSAVRYQLINSTLYRDENCNYPSRCKGNEHFIRQFIGGSDFDILVNVHDWAVNPTHRSKHLPVFSFSKTKDYGDIMYPAWSFWSGGPAIKKYPMGLGRWDLHYDLLLKENTKWPWRKKYPRGFFRGSRTSDVRDVLIKFSIKYPNLVDARYTKNQAFKSKEKDTLNLDPAEEVSMEYHCRYKYLFNFRGVAASFRFKYLFMCRSLIFHVGDDWIEFFYPALKPWIHYIPLGSDFTEGTLMDLLQFFENHDDIAEKIAERGFQFVKSTLKMSDVTWYWKRLLEKYSKLLKFKVERDLSLIII